MARSYVNVLNLLGRLSWYWNLAKFPMFALFAGSGVWMIAASWIGGRGRAAKSDFEGRFGRALIAGTLVALAYTSWQTTLETPRLWMAFLPMLGMGMAVVCDLFRADIRNTRAALLMLVAIHIGATAVQWTLFDARESEARLISGRMYE